VNCTSESGSTLVHFAAVTLFACPLIQFLKNNGALCNVETRKGMTPLHWAARNPHPEAVQLLLSLGASPHQKDSYGNTALHYAADCGNRAVVRLLLKWADNPRELLMARNKRRRTALTIACEQEERKTVSLLIRRGALVDDHTVRVAIRQDALSICKILWRSHNFRKSCSGEQVDKFAEWAKESSSSLRRELSKLKAQLKM